MKNILLITAALSFFFSSCGPKETLEPEPKTLVGHVYVAPYVDPWGNIEYWGYEFKSNDSVEIIEYVDSQIISWSEKYGYSFNFPILEIENIKYIVNEEYFMFQELNRENIIFTKIK